MARVILVLAVALVLVTAVFGIKACSRLSEERRDATPIPKDIVVLVNGMVVEAPDGSVAKRLVEWLEKPQQPEQAHQVFHLGGVQFEGRSTVPTEATRHRVPALVKMLSAYPDVKASFIGFTRPTEDTVDDDAVEIERANWAVDALVKAGIDRKRLSARASTEADKGPAARALPERVDLELSKE